MDGDKNNFDIFYLTVVFNPSVTDGQFRLHLNHPFVGRRCHMIKIKEFAVDDDAPNLFVDLFCSAMPLNSVTATNMKYPNDDVPDKMMCTTHLFGKEFKPVTYINDDKVPSDIEFELYYTSSGKYERLSDFDANFIIKMEFYLSDDDLDQKKVKFITFN